MREMETVRAEVARRMEALDDWRYRAHARYAGKTYLSQNEFKRICEEIGRMRDELTSIRRLCDTEYFIVAPDRKQVVIDELRNIKDDIERYHASVRTVFASNPYESQRIEYTCVPVYQQVDAFCELARGILGIYPTDRELVGYRRVPVLVRRIGRD